MSNRSKLGRGARRGIPGYRPGEAVVFSSEQARAVLLDGIDCPYCTRRVLGNEWGIYACQCGWSGAFALPCSHSNEAC